MNLLLQIYLKRETCIKNYMKTKNVMKNYMKTKTFPRDAIDAIENASHRELRQKKMSQNRGES